MSQLKLAAIALVTLMVTGCGGTGRNYWLYPGPQLEASEEAVFVAYESHLLVAIDGEAVDTKCWGRRRERQGYQQQSAPCRLHIRPGEHSLVVFPREGSRERLTLTFAALPGRLYGLDRSRCRISIDGSLQTCRIEVMEVGTVEGGV